jgi:hypothetical protein
MIIETKNNKKLDYINLSTDIIKLLFNYYSITEIWALSRTCKYFYKMINSMIYSLFKPRLLKRMNEIIEFKNILDFFQLPINITTYVITGSIVLSTLLGEKWSGSMYASSLLNMNKNQDIDCFYTTSDDNVYETLSNMNNNVFSVNGLEYELQSGTYNDGFLLCSLYKNNDDIDRIKLIDFVLCSETIMNTLNDFDIVACSSYYNNKELYIPKPFETLFKRSEIQNKDYKRIQKYEDRGFILYSKEYFILNCPLIVFYYRDLHKQGSEYITKINESTYDMKDSLYNMKDSLDNTEYTRYRYTEYTLDIITITLKGCVYRIDKIIFKKDKDDDFIYVVKKYIKEYYSKDSRTSDIKYYRLTEDYVKDKFIFMYDMVPV